MSDNPFVGRWTYRSLLNDPNLRADFNAMHWLVPHRASGGGTSSAAVVASFHAVRES